MHIRPRMSRGLLGAALAMTLATMPSLAQPPAQPTTPGQARKYRATSAILIDKQSGQRRMPTEQEVADLVATLSTFTTRSENLPQTPAVSGAIAVHLGDGYSGVVLARANEDGAIETRCVFSFEEGAGFLGLVPDVQ